MPTLLLRRGLTLALLCYLPLVKWGLPHGMPRMLLFYGGGFGLAALAIWREGDWPLLRPLFARPVAGLGRGLLLYGWLVALGTLLLYAPLLQPYLPYGVYDLAALFDPLPLYLAVKRGGPWPEGWLLAGGMLGAVAEEWIFRAVLFWRWVQATGAPGGHRGWPPPGVLVKLGVVSAAFAALHWPQSPGMLAAAFLGSGVLGWLLYRRGSLAEVAVLHALFNGALLVQGVP